MEILNLKDFLETTATEIPDCSQVKRQKLDSIPFLLLVLKNETVSLLRRKSINNLNISKLYYRLYRLYSHTGIHHTTQIYQVKQLVRNVNPCNNQLCIPIKLIPHYLIDGIQIIHIPSGHSEVIIPTYGEFYNPYDIDSVIETKIEVDQQLLSDYVSNNQSNNLVDILLQATSTTKHVNSEKPNHTNTTTIPAKMIEFQKPTRLKNIAPPLKATVEYNYGTPYMINTPNSLFCSGILWINKEHWQQTICYIIYPSPAALDEMVSNITLNISFQRLYARFLESLIMSEKVNKKPIKKVILPHTDQNFFHFPIIHTSDLSYRTQTFQSLITSLWQNFTINYDLPKPNLVHDDSKQIQEIYTTYCKYAYNINCLLPETHTVSPLWYLLLKKRYKLEKFIHLIYQLHNLDIAFLDIINQERIPFIIWKNNYNITFYLTNHYSLVDLEDVKQKLKQYYMYYQQIKNHMDLLAVNPNLKDDSPLISKLQEQLADFIESIDIRVIGYIERQEIWFKHPLENTNEYHVIEIPDISIKEASIIENILQFSTDAAQNIEIYSRLI